MSTVTLHVTWYAAALINPSGGLHWLTAGAPEAAEAGIAVRPPSASNEMDPTAATITVTNAVDQRRVLPPLAMRRCKVPPVVRSE